MDAQGKDEWTECFVVTGVRLPLGYYFGASAATGQLAGKGSVTEFEIINSS